MEFENENFTKFVIKKIFNIKKDHIRILLFKRHRRINKGVRKPAKKNCKRFEVFRKKFNVNL